jgi:hypothetical protein
MNDCSQGRRLGAHAYFAFCPCGVVAFLSFLLTIASVGEVAADEVEDAKAAYTEGGQLFEEGRYEEALRKFKESYAIRPKASVLSAIGNCQREVGDYLGAISSLELYMEQKGTKLSKAEHDQIVAQIAEMKRGLGNVRVAGHMVGIRVSVDDVEVGVTPLKSTIPVSPGVHEVRLEAPEREPSVNSIMVTAGATAELDVDRIFSPPAEPQGASAGGTPTSGERGAQPDDGVFDHMREGLEVEVRGGMIYCLGDGEIWCSQQEEETVARKQYSLKWSRYPGGGGGLYMGLRFLPFLALGLDFGAYRYSVSKGEVKVEHPDELRSELWQGMAEIRGYLPFSFVDVYAKAGFGYWTVFDRGKYKVDGDIRRPDPFPESYEFIKVGAGATFFFAQQESLGDVGFGLDVDVDMGKPWPMQINAHLIWIIPVF